MIVMITILGHHILIKISQYFKNIVIFVTTPEAHLPTNKKKISRGTEESI